MTTGYSGNKSSFSWSFTLGIGQGLLIDLIYHFATPMHAPVIRQNATGKPKTGYEQSRRKID